MSEARPTDLATIRKKHKVRVTTALGLIIAEYDALMQEIFVYHEQQKDAINFVFIVTGGMLVASEFIKQSPSVLLLFPLLFSILGVWHADRTVRILRHADYIHNYLRLKADALLDNKFHVWQYETYKKQTRLFNKRFMSALDRARWLIFITPGLLALALFIILKSGKSFEWYEFGLLGLAIISWLGTLAVMWKVEETSGIKKTGLLDLDST